MNKKFSFEINDMLPQTLVKELDKYIIGQEEAKKSIAIAIRNRYRRAKLEKNLQEEISPSNIIMIGSTGVGKTEIARRVSKLTKAPFVKVEATKYTEVGYVGRDVESMVRDLAEASYQLVKELHLARVEDIAKKNAEKRILDLLVPPKKIISKLSNPFDMLFPKEPEETDTRDEAHIKDQRIIYSEKLKRKELEDTEVEIEVQENFMQQIL